MRLWNSPEAAYLNSWKFVLSAEASGCGYTYLEDLSCLLKSEDLRQSFKEFALHRKRLSRALLGCFLTYYLLVVHFLLHSVEPVVHSKNYGLQPISSQTILTDYLHSVDSDSFGF